MILEGPRVDVNEPIVPGESLGGLRLRAHISELQGLLDAAYLEHHGRDDWYRLVDRYEARYCLGRVEVGVQVHNGKVFKLIAVEGYEGALFGKLRVGVNAGEAMALEPRLYYDEAEEGLYIRGCPGVVLEVSEEDPLPHEVPSYPISAIAVFVPEIWTVQGMSGRW